MDPTVVMDLSTWGFFVEMCGLQNGTMQAILILTKEMFVIVISIFIGFLFDWIYSPVAELDFVPKYDGNACL